MSILSDLDTLVLRQTSHPPLTTKGAELTYAEMDARATAMYDAIQSIVSGENVTAYDAGATYDQYDPDIYKRFAGYNGRIWKAIYSGSPSTFTGETPSESVYWTQVTLAQLLPNVLKLAEIGSGASQSVKTIKLHIPTAEVLTLSSNPKAFGITVPAGYYAKVLDVDASMIYNTTQYATNGNIGVRYVGANSSVYGFDDNGFLFGALSRTVSGTKVMIDGLTDTQIIEATDLEVYVETGEPTDGDSDITIYCTYILIPV